MRQSESHKGVVLWVGLGAALGVGVTVDWSTAQAKDGVVALAAHRCAVFTVEVSRRSVIETSDPTTEVGQWIEDQEGWGLASIDFEVGQKPTGYPSGWVQVCLSPQSEASGWAPAAGIEP